MKSSQNHLLVAAGLTIFLMLVIALPVLARIAPPEPPVVPIQQSPVPNQPAACTTLGKPTDLPQPALINFDDLADADVIADRYLATFGVSFEDSKITQAIIYANEPLKAVSQPNVAINNAVDPNTSNNVPMVINFNSPKTHVGFYIGNSENTDIVATLTAYDVRGGIICQPIVYRQVPELTNLFVGIYDSTGSIVKVTLDYGDTALNETIDDLYFAPRLDLPLERKPLPTWTPIPTASPTGPAPTATPVVPIFAYHPVKVVQFNPTIFQPDLSIHGIEITQGIQCFDTSKGLSGCADNSLPVVNKKDTTARIYLKVSGPATSMNDVPVRLFLTANGVNYQANATGKATSTINQGNKDSADIYFNVNFNFTIPVSFYAIVDPDNLIGESNETNNRYPAVGTISLSFQNRTTLKVIGQRVDYHPSGYSGARFAGGWAVNGGAADWWEQVLPVRNNGINYSVASGYLNWTSWLTPCNSTGDNQHSMIQTLNTLWTLENAFSWWFSGTFTGANHVYGWVPNGGYPCGHADMPIYPHAGGLGVVGIGSDAPGTNTDNPGAGALIFGHELTHDYDLKHTNTPDSCGSNDGSSPFPYSSSSIQEFGFNPITGKIYDPATTHDLMSYCPSGGSKQGWISPYTWQQMFNDLSSPAALASVPSETAPVGVLAPSAAGASLVVHATIYNPTINPDGGGNLGTLYKVNAGASVGLLPGPYAVELHNVAGDLLASQTFTVTFDSEYDAHGGSSNSPAAAPPFSPDPNSQEDVSFIMPWVDGTTNVLLTYKGAQMDQKSVSLNPPQVLITSPTTGEIWLAGSTHDLTWQGLDIDGDPLTYSVFYSSDGGLNWSVLAADLLDTKYQVDTDSMAGGNDVRFRVVATDGVLSGVAETDQPITIPNHVPVPVILNPINGGLYLPGWLVVMEGIATDFEDGTLPDEALKWSSDVQGSLGMGPSLALNNLQAGVHRITLTVLDSFGVEASVSVMINVAYPVYLPAIQR